VNHLSILAAANLLEYALTATGLSIRTPMFGVSDEELTAAPHSSA
jgi:hypothetical protein